MEVAEPMEDTELLEDGDGFLDENMLEFDSLIDSISKGQCGPGGMMADSPTNSPKDFDLDEADLLSFCKEASRAFFDKWGLISHQINSYNDFVDNGIQKLFDSLGEVNVDPGYDPSKNVGSDWRHAKITFGKVKLEKPTFWTDNGVCDEKCLKLMPRHARLQNMSYSAQMKVKVKVQVYTEEPAENDKSKTGKGQLFSQELAKSDKHKTGKGQSIAQEPGTSDKYKTGKGQSIAQEPATSDKYKTGKGQSIAQEPTTSDKYKTGKGQSISQEPAKSDKYKTGKGQSIGQEATTSDKYKTGKGKSVTQEPITSFIYKNDKGQFVRRTVLSEDRRKILIGRIPVMVKSNLCWLHELDKSDCLFDYGGYFLIKGMEKAFIAQERRCLSRLWIINKPSWTVTHQALAKQKRIYVKIAELSKADGFNRGNILTVCFLYATMPIWILFFALGASSDKEVFQMIDITDCDTELVNILLATIREADELCDGFRKGGNALEYVNGQIRTTKFPPSDSIEECISKYLFPNINGHKQKALFLGYMVKNLLLAFTGKRMCENKDDFRNKRLDLAGDLLAREMWVQLRHAERLMVRAMQRDLNGDRDLQIIERYLDASIITNGLSRAFSTGSWAHPYIKMERTAGVVANLRRTNPLQMMSDLRKTRQQVAYTGKVGDARYPNPSYWGKLCFLSTPDGENCGLVKNLAITGLVSTSLTEPILGKLMSCGMEKLENLSLHTFSGIGKVFLNGDWIGVCQDCISFVTKVRSMRRRRLIHFQVEVKWDTQQREVRIFSEGGRIMRPLLVVENLHKTKELKGGGYSFQSLMDSGIIEFIGVEEEEDCQTAWGIKYLFEVQSSPRYTHCELDLSFLLGLSCSSIPFANHNYARRVLYQSEKHSQQAIGFSTTNPNIRFDTLSHQMYYPQKPLFRTAVSDCLGKSSYSLGKPEYFNGQNAIVAVNVHQGYNQEDSLVMNQASLERGMFRTEHFRSYKSDVYNKEFLVTKRLKPKDRVEFGKMESKIGRVDSLDEDGLPYIGASLQTGDIVIGKVAESGADHCIKLKHTEKGMVQKVVLSANDDGKNFAVVTLRQVRSPCLGDKFSSMHGQKGVVGLLESQENFPFTQQGIVPDIVINPHAFPTRQTPGQLLEAALGKGIACGGSMRYATPFTTPSVDVIAKQLHSVGYSRWGAERVCNGRTGEMMRCLIFIGPTFYQRLVHMAEDKVKFRNTGPVHPLTRQPVADRKRFGGVKFGEMERDCLLAHGAAANLHERLFMLSDSSQMHVCQKCTRVANVIQRLPPGGKRIRGPYCSFCQSSENVVKVDVPYGAKLLYQELFSMGICLKFETEDC